MYFPNPILSKVLESEIVDPECVLKQTPLSVTEAPPSATTSLETKAESNVISVIVSVFTVANTTCGIELSFIQRIEKPFNLK